MSRYTVSLAACLDTRGFDLAQSCAGSFFFITAGRSEHIGYSFAFTLKPSRLPGLGRGLLCKTRH